MYILIRLGEMGYASLLCLQPPTDCDWKAFEEMLDVWAKFKAQPSYRCTQVQRGQNSMVDYLPKVGRVQG